MILYPGRTYAGECIVEDIGFPLKAIRDQQVKGFSMDKEDLLKLPMRNTDSNKGDFGKILVIAGSKNMSGAAYFAAKAAYNVGAGLVRVLTVEANRCILQTQLPQAMISVWEEMDEASLNEILKWATSIVIGPGLGTSNLMREQIENILPLIQCPIVLDADGLNLLAQNEIWYDKIKAPFIVTPHMGEMSRLMCLSINELKSNRAGYALSYANAHSAICVLKDSSSVISDGKNVCYQRTGNHGMATGGSGDVLAGIIGGLAGMGCDPFMAACLGSCIHGCAGDDAACIYGHRSMTCVEILDSISAVLKDM